MSGFEKQYLRLRIAVEEAIIALDAIPEAQAQVERLRSAIYVGCEICDGFEPEKRGSSKVYTL